MATSLLALGLAITATAWACTAEHAGTLTVNRTSAGVGETVTLSASGLAFTNAPHDVLFLDPSVYDSAVGGANKCSAAGQPMSPNPVVMSDPNGAFTVSEQIPAVTKSGVAAICVGMSKVTGPFPALVDVTVVGGQPPPPPLAFAAEDDGETIWESTDPSSARLRNNLGAQPATGGPYDAHHIVPGKASLGADGRNKLAQHRIDINDADNGLWHERTKHHAQHTNTYYKEVNRRVSAASDEAALRVILRDIADEIRTGTFPR